MPKLSFEEFKRLRAQGMSLEDIQSAKDQNPVQKAASFVAKDLAGQINPQEKQGFFGSLFQKTFGSKGLAGVGQLPGRTYAAAKTAGADASVAQSQEQLAKVNQALIVKIRSLPDGDPNKEALQKQVEDNMKTMGQSGKTINDLQNVQTTPGEAIGTGLNAAATVGAFATPITSFGRILAGAGMGASAGAGSALVDKKSGNEVATSAAAGALTGAAVSGALEGLGSALKFFSKTKGVQQRTGYTYNKELQPPVKEIAQDIKNGYQTFGEQVANVVDDQGKPVYVGTYRTLLDKAKGQLVEKGTKLKTALATFDETNNKTVTREEVSKGILKAMQDVYGVLSNRQVQQIKFEVERMPLTMKMTQLENMKRVYDGLIPDSFWSKIGEDPALSFPSLVRYILRDNARRTINTTTADPAIQALNNAMGIAMDVRGLASTQIAKRTLAKVSEAGGTGTTRFPFSYYLSKLFDDVIFNPALTTRTAQGIRTLGANTGGTVARNLGRQAVTRPIIQAQNQ